jgi:hypothetical protein
MGARFPPPAFNASSRVGAGTWCSAYFLCQSGQREHQPFGALDVYLFRARSSCVSIIFRQGLCGFAAWVTDFLESIPRSFAEDTPEGGRLIICTSNLWIRLADTLHSAPQQTAGCRLDGVRVAYSGLCILIMLGPWYSGRSPNLSPNMGETAKGRSSCGNGKRFASSKHKKYSSIRRTAVLAPSGGPNSSYLTSVICQG